MSAEVVKFKPVGGDIVAGLRALADRIENGDEIDEVKFVVGASFTASGRFRAYCWGPCSNLEAMGAFSTVVVNGLVDGVSGGVDDAS